MPGVKYASLLARGPTNRHFEHSDILTSKVTAGKIYRIDIFIVIVDLINIILFNLTVCDYNIL